MSDWDVINNGIHWEIAVRHNLKDDELDDYAVLLYLLPNNEINISCKDSVIWLKMAVSFPPSLYIILLIATYHKLCIRAEFGKLKTPLKLKTFMWLLSQRLSPTCITAIEP